ncbi:uncharacterized protein B0I36DRAFT_364840 [Microdochium trichocladiopsis]|uniref:Uncharacterized protein n=1 Tax=Microdochium trichocladiopsis TaxID=1682393 RepID=A0A9P9BNE8_9PEZI|nr:uncharacterized protein B0I36DRAFT_364840 [Microdochium trichocladiopsis]KAH7027668.1 hypothetical protein B0I36DRAFT_364840 [Microdochium trichocladiopsis]
MASYPSSQGNIPPPQFPMPSPQPDQPSYGYPFADPAHSTSDFPVADAAPPPKRSKWRHFVKGTQEMIKKRWPRYFFLTAVCQGIICIAFESYTFGRFNAGVDEETAKLKQTADVDAQLKTIPTFLSLFMLGFLYEVVLTWDALIAKNTIQVIGLVISNLALLIYTSIQISDIGIAIDKLRDVNIIRGFDTWWSVHPMLVAIPCILAVGTISFALIAWKLYQEFAWDILKHIGADYRMKKRFLHYQIYIALLKFDFFFFIGFTVQFLVVVGGSSTVETALTAAAIPVTMGILLAAAWFTKKEFKPGVYGIVALYLGGLAYFIFKLARIYDPGHAEAYRPVAKSLSAFAVLTIILIVCTIVNALVCMFNFGHGLKQHLNAPRQELDKDQVSYSLNDVKQPQIPSRMTID